MPKFTFKKEPKPTGLQAVGHCPGVEIKYKGQPVGRIHAPQWSTKDNRFRVSFTCLKTAAELEEDSNCKWQHRGIKKTFESESQARAWLKGIDADLFVAKWNIVSYEDY